ncbi:hypothetical protein Scep_010133 [Stephania cephalantha]|uniref:Uncharacterized protein n=1 Tax=Stephania cephalantha TaxID=152367 RepID=A0AAP0PDT7_9MAGN
MHTTWRVSRGYESPRLSASKAQWSSPTAHSVAPLPPAPLAAPHGGGGGAPHIVRFPITIEPHGYDTLRLELRALGALDNDDVTRNDVFFHVHAKDHVGETLFDRRSARFHAELVKRHEKHTQATQDQSTDEEQFYYDAAGDW